MPNQLKEKIVDTKLPEEPSEIPQPRPIQPAKNSFWTKRKIAALILLTLVISSGIIGVYAKSSKQNNGSGAHPPTNVGHDVVSDKNGLPPVAGVSDCGTNKQLFTNAIIPADQISTIIPMGNFAPPGHINPTPHMYYNYLSSGPKSSPTPAKTTLYVPASMVITSITLFDNGSAPKPFNSYRIDFVVCNQVRGYFIHVMSLNDKLQAAFQKPYDRNQTSDVGAANPDHTYAKNVNIKLRAGEVLGTGGGASYYPAGVDVGLSDYRNAAPALANAARWQYDSHYVCSLDYFTSSISAALYLKIGDYKGLRDPGTPKCGEVYQDQLGTAQGTWFQKGVVQDGSLAPVEGNLTLGHNNFDHSQAVFSMGNNLQKIGLTTDAVYGFSPMTGSNTNVDFSGVKTPNTVYCYQTSNINDPTKPLQNVLVELLDSKTLRIAKYAKVTCGAGTFQMPTDISLFMDYVR